MTGFDVSFHIKTLASHFTQPHAMEFVTTQRGARFLIYEGHKYVINRRGRDGRIFWRCAKSRQCKGAVTTKENEIISSRSDEYNHPKMKHRL